MAREEVIKEAKKFGVELQITKLIDEDGFSPDEALFEWEEYMANNNSVFINFFDNLVKNFDTINNGLPVIIYYLTKDNKMLKKDRRSIYTFFNKSIIGLIRHNKFIIKINNKEEAEALLKKIKNTKMKASGRLVLAFLKEIGILTPEIGDKLNFKDKIKVNIINFNDEEINEKFCKNFEEKCKELNIKFKRINYIDTWITYSLENVNENSLETLGNMNGIREISNMLYITLD